MFFFLFFFFFLKASLALHKAEVIALRVALKQLAAENRKLHTDNRDVNRRAALLAQEIDERHASLENSTQTEVIIKKLIKIKYLIVFVFLI